MSVRVYLVITILLLCIAIVSNVVMYYKCYINNDINDPFVPENVGVYNLKIYFNKYKAPKDGIHNELQEYIQPFKEKYFSQYIVTQNKPTTLEYQQIANIGSYRSI